MKIEELTQKVNNFILPLCETEGIDLVDVDIKKQSARFNIEVLVDKPQGGITLDECAAFNKKAISKIEDENLITDSYVLSVSSPGVDRPLKNEKDFLRVLNREVRFHLAQNLGEKCEYAGIIKSVEDEKVIIQTKHDEQIIPISMIKKAIQII